MYTLVNGKLVWVPMAEAGEDGSDGGGGPAEGGEAAGGEESGDSASSQDDGLPPDIDDWMSPEARKAFEYDPFAPKEEEAGKGKEGKSGEGAGTEGAAAGGEDGGESASGKAQKESKEAEEGKAGEKTDAQKQIEELQKQVAQYQEMMHKQLTGQYQEGTGEEGKKKEGEGEEDDPLEKIPQYQKFNIPDEIKQKIFSQDSTPESMSEGLGMLMQGVAQVTHYNVRKEMAAMMDKRINSTVETKQSELTEKQKAEQTQKEIREDWEKTHSDLSDPELKPLIASVANQVVNETGAKEWNAKLRDDIAARVRKILGREEKASGEQKEEQGQQQRKKPPYASSGSSRAAGKKPENPQTQEISDVLGL